MQHARVEPVNVTACLVTRGNALEERFMAKVVIPANPDGCWIWTGAEAGRQGARYGRIWAGRRSAAGHPCAEQAHRVSYELFVGPIPEGLELDHKCRTTLCVNPKHLEPVTYLENQRRGFAPMQAQRLQTHCKRDHPFNDQNTYTWRGTRRCRVCQADDSRRYRERKRVA